MTETISSPGRLTAVPHIGDEFLRTNPARKWRVETLPAYAAGCFTHTAGALWVPPPTHELNPVLDARMEVKRGPILFRCDGTLDLGWEGLYQCLSLAASMQRRRRGTYFRSYLDPLSLAHAINRGNNDWIPADAPLNDPGDLDWTLRDARRLHAAAIVVVGDHVTEDLLRAYQQARVPVLVIDSAAAMTFPTSIVVNPLLGPSVKAYRQEKGSQLLLGRKYSLVRGVFRRQRTIRATEQPAPYRALVAFGEDDHGDQTLYRTQQLLELPKVDRVSIACRTHHARYDEIRDFADNSGGKVEVVTESKELMTRLVRAHFALTSGDGWALELNCVGIPQIMLPTKLSHVMNAKRMDDEGVGTFLGLASDVTLDHLAEAVQLILDDPLERLGMSRCARNLIDGRGGDRIVNGLEILLHTPWAKQMKELKIAA